MTPRPIPELAAAARDVLSVLDHAEIQACVIGALAVHRWGQPRATSDADFSALVPYGSEDRILDVLLNRYAPRRSDARAFALDNRVLLLRTSEGVDLDIALAAFPFELEALELVSTWEIVPTAQLRTCPAEHLMIYKLVAGRAQDLVDVETFIAIPRRARRGHIEAMTRSAFRRATSSECEAGCAWRRCTRS